MRITELKQVAAIVYNNDKFLDLTNKEITDFAKRESMKMQRLWDKHHHEDNWGVYKHPDYIGDLLFCWINCTSASVHESIRYMQGRAVPVPTKLANGYKDFSCFVDYPGLGMEIVKLGQAGIKRISYYNDVQAQVDTTAKLCGFFDVRMPKHVYERKGQYDAVFSFEVIEHFRKPWDYLMEIDKMLKPGGYLFITYGFSGVYVGHFDYYNIDGDLLFIKDAGKWIRSHVLDKYELLHVGFNSNPYIYRKKA